MAGPQPVVVTALTWTPLLSYGPSRGRIRILDTVIPATVAYREAASAQEPVHRFEPTRQGPTPSGLESLLSLVRELPIGLADAALTSRDVLTKAGR